MVIKYDWPKLVQVAGTDYTQPDSSLIIQIILSVASLCKCANNTYYIKTNFCAELEG